jgi:hypothetical protein
MNDTKSLFTKLNTLFVKEESEENFWTVWTEEKAENQTRKELNPICVMVVGFGKQTNKLLTLNKLLHK